jgi:hypothetical protein
MAPRGCSREALNTVEFRICAYEKQNCVARPAALAGSHAQLFRYTERISAAVSVISPGSHGVCFLNSCWG